MYKIIKSLPKHNLLQECFPNILKLNVRTFLSQAYYCHEVWENRLSSTILQRVNLDELYHDLDQRFQKTRQLSAVDVDIFVNAATGNSFTGEILDLVYKLRLSGETGNTLNSTGHGVVRALLNSGNKDELLNALDDRLNYGLFLDYYTANILLDSFCKDNDFTSGARVAAQLMLQEEFEHPLTRSLSLLHCYNYLLKPEGWPELTKPAEPEEEVKIRVKYLRNPYDDEHFDLRDPQKIVGKTLAMFTNNKQDPLNKSLNILGWTLFGQTEKVKSSLNDCKNITLYKEIVGLIPEEKRKEFEVKTESADIETLLKTNVEKAVQETTERDIAEQCAAFSMWESERNRALEEQKERLLKQTRLANIDDLQKALKEKESKLWFFDNEEQIELDIEAKKVYYPKRWFGKKKAPRKIDENYIPPEVTKHSNFAK